MKGLAIYSIVALGIFSLGFIFNIINGESSGYQVLAFLMLAPILVFACMYVAKDKKVG
jgi:MFS-type transporter involved in bile tolerance (Atg22 family)